MTEERKYTQQEIDEHVEAKFDQWLDNSNPEDLGIAKWARELLPAYTPQATPDIHIALYLHLLDLFDPSLVNRFERQLLLTSYRGSAKSTVANMFLPAYLMANNGRKMKILIGAKVYLDDDRKLVVEGGTVVEVVINESFIVIISETGGMAEDFVVRIRDEWSTNLNIRYYYQLEINNAYEDATGKWTRAAFKMNGCFLLGVGTGMQVRGRIKGPSRITTVIFDDIYSEKNTLTPESRKKIFDWFENAVINSVDDLRGKALLLGTIVHDDTLLISLEKDRSWIKVKYALMPLENFHELMNDHMEVNYDLQTCTLPYDNIKDEREAKRKNRKYFQELLTKKEWGLAWPERQDLYFLALAIRGKVVKGSMASLYQEYFHQVIPDEDKRIRKEFFVKKVVEYKHAHYYNWVRFEDEEQWRICNIEFGIDLSTGEGSDNGVITVTATLSDHRKIILLQKAAKFITRDDKRDDIGDDVRYEKVIMDRTLIRKAGVIDETFRLAMIYHPRKIKIGVGGQEKSIVKQFRQVFQANGEYVIIFESLPQTVREGEKVKRILDTLVGFYETRMVIHAFPSQDLEYELEFLGKATNDDRADSAAVSMTNCQLPPNLEIDFFEEVEVTPHIYEIGHKTEGNLAMKDRWRTI